MKIFDDTDCSSILPSQLVKSKTRLQGEIALMVAVLEDAIRCYLDFSPSSKKSQERKLFKEAEAWIFNTSREELFSFESICDALGINTAKLRKYLIEKKNDSHSDAPNPLSTSQIRRPKSRPKRRKEADRPAKNKKNNTSLVKRIRFLSQAGLSAREIQKALGVHWLVVYRNLKRFCLGGSDDTERS